MTFIYFSKFQFCAFLLFKPEDLDLDLDLEFKEQFIFTTVGFQIENVNNKSILNIPVVKINIFLLPRSRLEIAKLEWIIIKCCTFIFRTIMQILIITNMCNNGHKCNKLNKYVYYDLILYRCITMYLCISNCTNMTLHINICWNIHK